MPRYDYRCTACEREFEISRPIGATTDEICPTCSAPAKRVFTPVGVVFKGSGFHNTDYRTPAKPEASSDSPAPPAPSCGSECGGCPAASS